jgi:hypothetical protein
MRMLKSARPALAACLAASCLFSPRAARGEEADQGLDFKYMYYWDRNDVWNHTPALRYFKKIASAWKLQWNQEFDVVSGASRRLGAWNVGRSAGHDSVLDAITAASKREVRHSEQATVAYARQGRAASASFYFSDENDYRSYSPAVSGSWDFNRRNTTLSGGLALFFDELRPQGGFAGLGGKRKIVSASLGLTQLLTPLSLVSFSVQPIFSSGLLGHPYNPVITSSGNPVVENLPPHKLSAAFTATLVQGFHLAGRLGSIHLEARHYRDDWDLVSNTADLQWYQYFADGAFVRLRVRGYDQGAAAFARNSYQGNEIYRSPDIRYYAFSSLLAGVKVGSNFPESWQDSPWLPDRWDLSYDHGIRDTKGELDGEHPFYHYQLFTPEENYAQGTLMAGLGFDF